MMFMPHSADLLPCMGGQLTAALEMPATLEAVRRMRVVIIRGGGAELVM